MSIRLPAEQYLNEVIDQLKADPGPLSEWEHNFMRDQCERYEEYQSDTRFSGKQWAIIMKIGDLFDIERVELDEHAC